MGHFLVHLKVFERLLLKSRDFVYEFNVILSQIFDTSNKPGIICSSEDPAFVELRIWQALRCSWEVAHSWVGGCCTGSGMKGKSSLLHYSSTFHPPHLQANRSVRLISVLTIGMWKKHARSQKQFVPTYIWKELYEEKTPG